MPLYDPCIEGTNVFLAFDVLIVLVMMALQDYVTCPIANEGYPSKKDRSYQ
ncbi:hypothetical protein SLEP1_g18953 [Rubroshorea leprosula]|uniref:Uncharacterized protein n=1 Tax=Rubroshorea leprosula TaxID=152421 RepID=A0AAV5J851_9ROSI|nr:hypothetical protein SLEP1_g18953 [Rubroshorea leprosula]